MRDREHALLETVSRQAEELLAWNQQLEARVEEKVQEVERLGKLQRFVAPQLAEILMSDRDGILESHRREIALLFCDLRGFTPFSETAEPEDVMAVLRELHEAVVPLVFVQAGTLAQFTGDGMMIIFNDPIVCTEPALRAVELGVSMIQRASELAEFWRKRGHLLEMGAGVALGYATCGRIGYEGRFEYTAIGTVVNLAARLCAEALGGQLLVSERVRGVIEATHRSESVADLVLKGSARPIRGYAVTQSSTTTEG
jgi:adenylate cyclase